MLGKGTKDGSLFSLDLEYQPSAYFSTSSDISLWHRRLGHPNDQKLLYMFKNKLLPGNFSLFHNYQCHACSSAKAKTLSFPLHSNKTSSCFELAHSDVWGVTPVISQCGYKYFITFIDDFSRFTWSISCTPNLMLLLFSPNLLPWCALNLIQHKNLT